MHYSTTTYNHLDGRTVTRASRVREVWGLNSGSAKSCTALQTVSHRFKIYASSYVASAL